MCCITLPHSFAVTPAAVAAVRCPLGRVDHPVAGSVHSRCRLVFRVGIRVAAVGATLQVSYAMLCCDTMCCNALCCAVQRRATRPAFTAALKHVCSGIIAHAAACAVSAVGAAAQLMAGLCCVVPFGAAHRPAL